MTFVCPKCTGREMIKFIKQPDLRNKIHACKDCGYRYMSPGWQKRHGTFLTGVVV
jgi:ribosomal protein L37AE/L43A